MREGSLFNRFESLAAASCVAAHANAGLEGFRQKDVRFIIELFSNWIELSLSTSELPLNNTQVARYLDQLSKDGLARRTVSATRPMYRLTRLGIIELLNRTIPSTRLLPPEQCYFVVYFLKNYRTRLIELIEREGKQFPLAMRLEIDSLLDSNSVLQSQLDLTERELLRLDERIADSGHGSRLAKRLFADGLTTAEVARKVQQINPYELNSQKPLSELLSEVPADLGRWELEIGALKRAAELWTPLRTVLQAHKKNLRELLRQAD